jgi:hypothetical protein
MAWITITQDGFLPSVGLPPIINVDQEAIRPASAEAHYVRKVQLVSPHGGWNIIVPVVIVDVHEHRTVQ